MKTVIEMALDTGFDADDETTLTSLQRFAALVIANNPPQSSMAWQEGYEAGKQAEREACANVCKQQSLLQLDERVMRGIDACTDAILARGQA